MHRRSLLLLALAGCHGSGGTDGGCAPLSPTQLYEDGCASPSGRCYIDHPPSDGF